MGITIAGLLLLAVAVGLEYFFHFTYMAGVAVITAILFLAIGSSVQKK